MTEDELQDELARLRKRTERERRARQEAEQLAEHGIRELYERQRELALFNTITDAANGATSIREAIQVTLNEICAYTAWPVGHAYFVGTSRTSSFRPKSGIWTIRNASLTFAK